MIYNKVNFIISIYFLPILLWVGMMLGWLLKPYDNEDEMNLMNGEDESEDEWKDEW